jgi:hypothetical protein
MMSREEFMSLVKAVEFLKGREDFPQIYADVLDDYVRGLLSMGCEPK